MIWDDVKNIESYSKVLKNIDIVYHLAGASDIAKSLKDTYWDLNENVISTHAVLEYMRINRIKQIVFSSTSVVQGEHAPKPTPEDVGFDPGSLYAASKCAAEMFIRAYSHIYGIKACILRFGNVIGRHEHRGVIYDFLLKLMRNQRELEILGDGNQIKSYIHVSDVIDAMMFIPQKMSETVDVFNVAVPEWKTVNELADIICDELGIQVVYKHGGGDRGWEGDIPVVMLDVSKVYALGWRPKLSVEEAIRRTVRELKKEMELII